jgi:uncharacterized protein
MREITKKIKENLDNDLMLIIVGARQTGKTTILKQLYTEEKEKNKFFINLENLELLEILNVHPDNLFKITNTNSNTKQIIFIDEIQYLNNPTNFLKYIYDEYKGFRKIIATGSTSFYIDNKFKDSLLGRKRIFNLYTLTFREFLNLKNEVDLINKDKFSMMDYKKIENLFSEYITYGGYPAVVNAKNIEEKKLILQEIGLDYIKKDIFESKLQSQEKYYSILRIIANNVGSLFNANDISKTLKISSLTVDNYLYVMQKSFHVSFLRPFYNNVKKELTKMPKAYFLDLGLRNYFCKNFENIEMRNDKGFFLENIIFREFLIKYGIDNIKFWRTQDQHEIDFVINEDLAVEVKFDKEKFNIKKYSKFTDNYPNIKLKCMDYKDIINFVLDIKN